MEPLIRAATEGELTAVHAIQLAAFAETAAFEFPSSALHESLGDVRRAAQNGGAVVATMHGRFVASGRFQLVEGAYLSFERLAVLPELRNRRIGVALVRWMERHGVERGVSEVRCTARSRMPDNRAYYQRLGYRIAGYSGRYGIPDIRTHMVKASGLFR